MGSLKDMNVDYLSGGFSSPIGPGGQSDSAVRIKYIGFEQLAAANAAYEGTYVGLEAPVNKMLMAIAKDLREKAKDKSPYWLGGLREAHESSWEMDHAVVHINPEAPPHPRMGGQPYDYGYIIHTEGGPGSKPPREWFYHTWLLHGEEIAAIHTDELVDIWATSFSGYNTLASI
jgi:hypothetical protein